MFNGRLVIDSELPVYSIRHYHFATKKRGGRYYRILKQRGIQYQNEHWRCLRCGAICDQWILQTGEHYCRSCIAYHRVSERTWLYSKPWQSSFHPISKPLLAWEGQLSVFQQPISQQLVQASQPVILVYAVTGAGKTEMVYHYLQHHLQQGKRVVYVAPRIDVVKELATRFRRVFPTLDIPCLYGDSPEQYRCRPFTVMTIQQLIRFQRCVDCLLIDEVDAFPYAGNQQLKFFVDRALAVGGQKVYLTATLTPELEQQMEQLCVFRLPIRYHLQPLPVPCIKWLFQSYRFLRKKRLPYLIKQLLRQRTRAVLIFFPNIEQMKRWEILLRNFDHQLKVASVSSQDECRDEKITAMRHKQYDVLLTTMILERGVTFENIDVWIMDAHHPSFTKSALIQISGRVGRKKEYPTGKVYWIAEGKTKAMLKAMDEIKQQNRWAQQCLEERNDL